MDSIDQIWKTYHSGIFGFIIKRVGDSSVADDLLQEVFLKVHSRIDTFKEGTNLKAWLYHVTRNTITDYYRTRKPDAELPKGLSGPEKTPTEKAKEETQKRLIAMIQSLPPPYDQTLMLAEIERLPHKEVAKRLGVTLTCAKSRIQRGRQLLRKKLFSACNIELDHRGCMLDCEPTPATLKHMDEIQSSKDKGS